MQFYPHNISISEVGTAVSASLTATGSLINNFAALTIKVINTASLALNITGSRGADGTNVAVSGPKGATGDQGLQGYRGNNIYLLSSGWNDSVCGGPPVTCYGPFTLYKIGPGIDACNTDQGSQTLYSDADSTIINSNIVGDADGYILYTNNTCTTTYANSTPSPVHNTQGAIFYTDGSGVISSSPCGS